MRSRLIPVLVALTALAAACGSDDDSSGSDTVADEAPADTADDPAEEADTDASGDAESDGSADEGDDGSTGDGDASAPTPGGGTALLTLSTGETFEFSVLCTLEPQMAAGSEILFTAVSYDDPGLDITQFGDEGTVTGTGSVSVYDGNFETLWEASTFFEAFGGALDLTLDGSTIRGSGTFYPAGDPTAGEGVPGEIVANC